MSLRIWENLPPAYRASDDPEEIITLWRGDVTGKGMVGMTCELEESLDPEDYVYKSLFKKYPNIRTLVKRHTHSNHNSPFISLTDSLELADTFSPDPTTNTVYQITVPAYRLVIDPPRGDDTPHIEALAIGRIEPGEITAIL